jgi:hypothetical protein
MEDAIERKLRRELSSKAHLTEARVVYILAEVRKLIERTRQQQTYFALNFHCSWALHTTTDRGRAAARILKRFDEAYELLRGKSLSELPRILANEIQATVGLETFRASLQAFLTAYGLPTTVVQDNWTKFLRQYVAVIEDCPLTIKDPAISLNNIKQVTVHKDDAHKKITEAGESFKVFRIRWVSHGKNNKTGTIEVYYTIP